MTKLPQLSGKESIKILLKSGFVHTKKTGSHAILKKQTDKGTVVVPVPLHDELAKGTLLSIIYQAGFTREEFIAMKR